MLRQILNILFFLADIALFFLLLIKLLRFYSGRRAGRVELIIRSIGSSKFSAISSMLPPLVFLSFFIDFGDRGINGFKSIDLIYIVLFVMLAIYNLVDGLSTIQIREKGLITKQRFIEWKKVDGIKEVVKSKGGAILDKYIEVSLRNTRFFKKIKLRTDLYEGTKNLGLKLEEMINLNR